MSLRLFARLTIAALLLFALGDLPELLADEQRRQDDLTVLSTPADGLSPRQMLGRYLKRQAYEALDQRRVQYESLKTPEQIDSYQQRMRREFADRLGGFPERTPLNAKTVGQIDGDGFRAERLIYESQPQHYVTAVLFLPKSKPPFPAVLVPCGHSRSGKAANQRVCMLLAKHGIAALSYDPIGQGERYQMLDQTGTPRFRPTTEHTLLGTSCIPLGRNTASYRVWDGIRSIDYLASRKDIDPARIGVTGCSGGGTLTSYLMALDERVTCAAPSCYLTSFRRLIDTIGPQDAEQNIFGQIALGMDHADYVLIRAPKPTLILASTHDFFDIQGTWDTFRQAKRLYTRLGFAERVNLVETDAKHGYPRLQREAMARWMRRWLTGLNDPVTEPEFDTLPGESIQVTPRGQVMLLDGARSVLDLNAELDEQLAQQRREAWTEQSRAETLAEVRKIAGIRPLSALPYQKVKQVDSVQRNGFRLDKLVLKTEPGIDLPALLFTPKKNASDRRILYLHGEGKHVDAEPGGPIDALVQAGHLVLAVDLRGMGETGPAKANMWGGNTNDIFLSYLLGRSLVGMRAEDIVVAARFLSEHDRDRAAPVELIAIGAAGPPALHAAALECSLFTSVQLKDSLKSWSDVVRDPTSGSHLVSVVHGALKTYDLPDLLAVVPAAKSIEESPKSRE